MKRHHLATLVVFSSLAALGAAAVVVPDLFITSDRCLACHNGLVTPRGED
jgi:hypothetical protein